MNVEWTLLNPQERYVVGVSGGPDSMALLELLYQKHFSIVVASVNYHVRKDSDLDLAVVKNYCAARRIPFYEKHFYTYEKGNFEAQARSLRYRFFVQTVKKTNSRAIVLAHHRDDFLETVLMQKKRGMQDIVYGIQTCSVYQGVSVLRPLMACWKEELLAYCQKQQVPFRIDSTNLENHYTRNMVRNTILADYSLAMKETLYEEIQKENAKTLLQQADHRRWLAKQVHDRCFSLSAWRKTEDPLGILRLYLTEIIGLQTRQISGKLLRECARNLQNSKPNIKIYLPVNFVLIKEYDNVYVTKLKQDRSYHYTILDGTPCVYPYFKIALSGDDREGIAVKENDFPLTIRNRRPGDVISLAYGQKKLSRLLIDAKIPASQRALWPVVLNAAGEIILVPKIAKNKRYLLAKPTLFVIQ